MFPCGVCEKPVTWSQIAVCCSNCSIWHHKTCESINTQDMSHLEKSDVVWHCHKCNSANIDSFTFHSYELEMSNTYFPLSNLEDSMDIRLAQMSLSAQLLLVVQESDAPTNTEDQGLPLKARPLSPPQAWTIADFVAPPQRLCPIVKVQAISLLLQVWTAT